LEGYFVGTIVGVFDGEFVGAYVRRSLCTLVCEFNGKLLGEFVAPVVGVYGAIMLKE